MLYEAYPKYLGDIGARARGSYARTIIIPAYNEEQRIGPTLEKYLGHFDEDTEVIVVLNGCRDRTIEVVSAFMKEHPNLRLVDEPGVVGKGGAVARGFSKARGEIVAYSDADCAYLPDQIEKLMREVGEFDGAVGSRWIRSELNRETQGRARAILSQIFNLLVRLLFGLPYRDTQSGAKVFKREAVEAIAPALRTKNLAFDVEVLYLLQQRGYRLCEKPIVWVDVEGSTIRPIRDGLTMLSTIVLMRLKYSRFERFVRKI